MVSTDASYSITFEVSFPGTIFGTEECGVTINAVKSEAVVEDSFSFLSNYNDVGRLTDVLESVTSEVRFVDVTSKS